jgi:lysophospholipase L1-like esterase
MNGGRARRILALLAVAVGVALALEAATRALGIAPGLPTQYGDNVADPHIPYKRAPGSVLRGVSASGEFEFEYRHGREGFRDLDRPQRKPPGVFRIVALGDSFTYGDGAPFEATWPSRLEQLLRQRGGAAAAVEVVRLGLPRYFPGAERLVLEHVGLRYEPDLVLVAVLPNDVVDTHFGIEAIQVGADGFLRSQEGQRMGPLAGWLFARSHVARIVLRRIVEWQQERRSPVRFADVYREGGLHEDDWRRLEQDLAALATRAREAGARFALISIPQQGPWTDESRYPDRRLAAWSARHEVPFIPTLDALAAASGANAPTTPLYYPRDGHCTPTGYHVVAQEIARALVAQGLVP